MPNSSSTLTPMGQLRSIEAKVTGTDRVHLPVDWTIALRTDIVNHLVGWRFSDHRGRREAEHLKIAVYHRPHKPASAAGDW
jgi:hypothetical protein